MVCGPKELRPRGSCRVIYDWLGEPPGHVGESLPLGTFGRQKNPPRVGFFFGDSIEVTLRSCSLPDAAQNLRIATSSSATPLRSGPRSQLRSFPGTIAW